MIQKLKITTLMSLATILLILFLLLVGYLYNNIVIKTQPTNETTIILSNPRIDALQNLSIDENVEIENHQNNLLNIIVAIVSLIFIGIIFFFIIFKTYDVIFPNEKKK